MAPRPKMFPGLIVSIVLSVIPDLVYAGFDVTLYSGMSSSRASDVTLDQPGDNTHLMFQDVAWDDKSFENPIYWGMRVTYWLKDVPGWGIAMDFTHAKIHADPATTVNVSGTRAGNPVSGQEPLGNTFSTLAMSHGYNLLTINVLNRWQWMPGFRPYLGAGGGLAYPHVEVQTASSFTDEYQLAGWAVNGMAGLNYELGKKFAIFAEYKLSYANIKADLNGGGSLKTSIWTNHFNLGLTYHFEI